MGQFINLATRLEDSFTTHADKLALRWRERESDVFYEITYEDFHKRCRALALGLLAMGVKHQDHIGLIADVSSQWTTAEVAIQLLGCVDVPRGTDSMGDELAYIIDHAECKLVFVHYAAEIGRIEKGLEAFDFSVDKYIVLTNHVPQKFKERAVTLNSVIEKGYRSIDNQDEFIPELEERIRGAGPEDLVSIVYTSGTTGRPKGVMLAQSNISAQVDLMPELFATTSEDRGLAILPPWHIFGRITEYAMLLSGGSITYTDIRNLGLDMRDIRPTFFPAVPRIWEGFYNKLFNLLKRTGKEETFYFYKKYSIKYFAAWNILQNKERNFIKRTALETLWIKIKAFVSIPLFYPLKKAGDFLIFRKLVDATGGQIRLSAAGGAALPAYIDDFFASIGIPIAEGYGLTETSGAVSLRLLHRLVPGTVGPPVKSIEYKLLDESGKDVTDIEDAAGTLYVRGPLVMGGYYKNPEKTKEVLDEQGWFNTGDICKLTQNGELCIVGRSKDTVVLRGGENVEPTPIEDRLKESDFIDHVMVVGQDQKTLGALIVPNEKELGEYVRGIGIRSSSLAVWIDDKRVTDFYKKEVGRLISHENGFKHFERIQDFRLLTKPFEKGDELNNTMKIRRHIVDKRYGDLIKEMYSKQNS